MSESAAVTPASEPVSRHTLSEDRPAALRACFTQVHLAMSHTGHMNGLGVDVDPSGEQFLGLVDRDPG